MRGQAGNLERLVTHERNWHMEQVVSILPTRAGNIKERQHAEGHLGQAWCLLDRLGQAGLEAESGVHAA